MSSVSKSGDEIRIVIGVEDAHSLRVALAECPCKAAKSIGTKSVRASLSKALARVSFKRTYIWPDLWDDILETAAADWPKVLDSVRGSDMEGFALSIRALIRQRGTPSPKQIALMKSLWTSLQIQDDEVTE